MNKENYRSPLEDPEILRVLQVLCRMDEYFTIMNGGRLNWK